MNDATGMTPQEKLSAIEAMGEDASTCTACDLAKSRTKVVFGVGKPSSPLMLVGEGPGATEDALGEPFVGRAGVLLDECLYEAGMTRAHIYLTNIVKCRACIEQNGRIQNRVPAPAEIDTCVPLWLQKQIDVIQPLVICAIGAPAANVIIHANFRITKERGQFFDSKFAPYSIAALLPAYILRQEGDDHRRARQTLVDDLRAAKEKAIAAK
jgi:uracil-DNA glycosylase family 4